MNDEQREDALTRRNRSVLHDLEDDWQETLGAIRAVQDREFEQYRARLGEIHAGYRKLAIWLVCISAAGLAVVVVGFAIITSQQRTINGATAQSLDTANRLAVLVMKTTAESSMNGRALCALRHDVEERVRQGTAFLRSHPQGLPGFPAGAIRVSISNSARTVRVLSGLQCPAP